MVAFDTTAPGWQTTVVNYTPTDFFLSILAVFLGKTKGKRAYLLVCLFVFFSIRFLFETYVAAEMIPAVLDEMLRKGENCVIKLRHNATRDY